MAVAIEALPTKVIADDARAWDGVPQDRGWQGLHPGAEINGRYALGRLLGAGGSGSVYRAEDLKLHRPVALKVLHPHLGGDPKVVERFRREARFAARLNDRHLARVYDLGHWARNHFMAMEFVSGRPLSKVIREHAPFGPPRAMSLIVQMLGAARCIHGQGIVHRDLKPANAIVDRDGRLTVVDFGIAHADGEELTETGSVLGTARYASPEQSDGGEVTPASDLYSIGSSCTSCSPDARRSKRMAPSRSRSCTSASRRRRSSRFDTGSPRDSPPS